jgi:hypothetical protein
MRSPIREIDRLTAAIMAWRRRSHDSGFWHLAGLRLLPSKTNSERDRREAEIMDIGFLSRFQAGFMWGWVGERIVVSGSDG